MNQGDICIVVAFMVEARPIIRRWGLKQNHEVSLYPFFTGETEWGKVSVLVTGMGVLNMAQGISWVFGAGWVSEYSAWLNFGIAGHSQFAVGDVFMVNQCFLNGTKQRWYPPQIQNFKNLKLSPIYCVSEPESEFEKDGGYDMESAGYYSATSKFATAELCQSLKVVSDNKETSWKDWDKSELEALCDRSVDDIERVASALTGLSAKEKELYCSHPLYEEILRQYHFTKTQEVQLQHLLRRWKTFFGTQDPAVTFQKTPKTAKEYLSYLEETLNFPMPNREVS